MPNFFKTEARSKDPGDQTEDSKSQFAVCQVQYFKYFHDFLFSFCMQIFCITQTGLLALFLVLDKTITSLKFTSSSVSMEAIFYCAV